MRNTVKESLAEPVKVIQVRVGTEHHILVQHTMTPDIIVREIIVSNVV